MSKKVVIQPDSAGQNQRSWSSSWAEEALTGEQQSSSLCPQSSCLPWTQTRQTPPNLRKQTDRLTDAQSRSPSAPASLQRSSAGQTYVLTGLMRLKDGHAKVRSNFRFENIELPGCPVSTRKRSLLTNPTFHCFAHL